MPAKQNDVRSTIDSEAKPQTKKSDYFCGLIQKWHVEQIVISQTIYTCRLTR